MVTPYLTQHSPPALVATLPPIEQISYEEGSGGYHSPCSAAAALTSALNAPGSTTATRVATSISMARIRSRLSTMPPSTALDPPDRPLPAPRGTTRYAVGGRPAHGGLDLGRIPGPDHGDGRSCRWVAGPVEAVVLQRDVVGADGVSESLDQLLNRGVHRPTVARSQGSQDR